MGLSATAMAISIVELEDTKLYVDFWLNLYVMKCNNGKTLNIQYVVNYEKVYLVKIGPIFVALALFYLYNFL